MCPVCVQLLSNAVSLTCMCTDTCQAHQDTAELFYNTDCIMQPSHSINTADAALESLGPAQSLNLVRPACVHMAGHTAHICAGGETVGLHECTPKCAQAGRPGHPCKHGWERCVPACVCACVWHKQETGLWPLLLPCGREALQNVPDRWRQPLTTDLPHLPRTRPSPAPAHVREPDWTSEF